MLSLFLNKKFKISIDDLFSNSNKIKSCIKTKRNEEILKFVLKGFFKFLCKLGNNG